MNDTITTPVHARPKEVMLIRDGHKIPLELAFEGVDHKNFGLWKICTRLRGSDRVHVTDLGFNYVRGEFE